MAMRFDNQSTLRYTNGNRDKITKISSKRLVRDIIQPSIGWIKQNGSGQCRAFKVKYIISCPDCSCNSLAVRRTKLSAEHFIRPCNPSLLLNRDPQVMSLSFLPSSICLDWICERHRAGDCYSRKPTITD